MNTEQRTELEQEGYTVGTENPIEELAAECVECGETTRAMATVWLTRDADGNTVPRDDVSYRCPRCDKVTERDIRVTERGEEPWIWKER